ncbi:hypothetical protein Tco_0921958 [Tanacetum coccineum]|uniref:Uncharacterized protein n=1 Tax=Tanacetum coccineum TaxID=301880 RepID=A0ABQ5D3Z6_9ASTR
MEELLQAPTEGENFSKTDERIDKLADQILTLVEIVSKKVVTSAMVKAVEESYVTCGGAHAYYNCPNTDSNQSSVCAETAVCLWIASSSMPVKHGDLNEHLLFSYDSTLKILLFSIKVFRFLTLQSTSDKSLNSYA